MSTPITIKDGTGTNVKAGVNSSNALLVTVVSPTITTNGIAFGRVTPSVTTSVVIRATTYTEQTVNSQRSLASSSANDSSGGTGAQQVQIVYYDQFMKGPLTDVVVLNGTTSVPTNKNDICFIEKMIIISVGSSGANAGTISLFVNNAGGGGTIGTIAVNDNQTFWSHHYVARGNVCNILAVTAGTTGNQNGQVVLQSQNPLVSTSMLQQNNESISVAQNASSITRAFSNVLQIYGPNRIALYITPVGANTTWFASFDFSEQIV